MPKPKPNVFDGQSIAASEFFKTHWQRAPFLFKNTAIDLSCLPNQQQLFQLAEKHGVQSRIVFSENDTHYQVVYDEPGAWQGLKAHKPTLLVSDIEKWYPKALSLMQWFPFIKNWRFDDLMMSFAPNGASVGAHTDHYDVFLVQVQGTRQWSYDNHPLGEVKLVEDSELAVIENYLPQNEIELKAGDILYLPPEIPHHGISTSDDCITCSIGLRAPAKSELLTEVVSELAHAIPTQNRFKDTTEKTETDNSIGQHEISYLRNLFKQLHNLPDETLADLFGQFITNYRLLNEGETFSSQHTDHGSNLFCKNPFSVFAYHDNQSRRAHLYVDGEMFETSLHLAKVICNKDQFTLLDLLPQPSENDSQVINHLAEMNIITQYNP